MQNRFLYSVCFILAIMDLLFINASYFLAFQIYYWPGISDEILRHHLFNLNLIWLISSNLFQLYNKSNIKKIEQILRSTWKSLVVHVLIFTTSIVVLRDTEVPGKFIALFYSICFAIFLISRFLITVAETVLTRRYKIRKPVAVMGLNEMGLRLASFFEGNKKQYLFQGFLDSEHSFYVDKSGTLLPAVCDQIKKAAANNIQEVYVTLSTDRMGEVNHLLQEAEKQCVRLKFVPDFTKTLSSPFTINYMGEFPIISMRAGPLETVENRFKKRLADILFSLLIIICVLIWVFPLIALAIKISSPGPILFKQYRNGRNNQPFYCYKFRSMVVNGDSDKKQACRNDDRVTPIGKFLRKTSLDELPQFFNVLWGNMSVVGPRPHMLKHTEEYRAIINRYMIRHYLKPGITGWAQVNGLRGETSKVELMEKRIEHDIWYLDNWSMMLDVKIAFLTVIHIFRGGKNVY